MDNSLKMKKGATLDITQRFSPIHHVMHIFALFELDSGSRELHQAKLRNNYNFRCALGPVIYD